MAKKVRKGMKENSTGSVASAVSQMMKDPATKNALRKSLNKPTTSATTDDEEMADPEVMQAVDDAVKRGKLKVESTRFNAIKEEAKKIGLSEREIISSLKNHLLEVQQKLSDNNFKTYQKVFAESVQNKPRGMLMWIGIRDPLLYEVNDVLENKKNEVDRREKLKEYRDLRDKKVVLQALNDEDIFDKIIESLSYRGLDKFTAILNEISEPHAPRRITSSDGTDEGTILHSQWAHGGPPLVYIEWDDGSKSGHVMKADSRGIYNVVDKNDPIPGYKTSHVYGGNRLTGKVERLSNKSARALKKKDGIKHRMNIFDPEHEIWDQWDKKGRKNESKGHISNKSEELDERNVLNKMKKKRAMKKTVKSDAIGGPGLNSNSGSGRIAQKFISSAGKKENVMGEDFDVFDDESNVVGGLHDDSYTDGSRGHFDIDSIGGTEHTETLGSYLESTSSDEFVEHAADEVDWQMAELVDTALQNTMDATDESVLAEMAQMAHHIGENNMYSAIASHLGWE